MALSYGFLAFATSTRAAFNIPDTNTKSSTEPRTVSNSFNFFFVSN